MVGRFLRKFDEDRSGTLEFEEFKQLRRELKIEPFDVEDRVLFGLTEESKRLSALSSLCVSCFIHELNAGLTGTAKRHLMFMV